MLRGLAELIAESAGPSRDRALAERELSTLVARRGRENVAELAGTAPTTATSDGLCAAILTVLRGALGS